MPEYQYGHNKVTKTRQRTFSILDFAASSCSFRPCSRLRSAILGDGYGVRELDDPLARAHVQRVLEPAQQRGVVGRELAERLQHPVALRRRDAAREGRVLELDELEEVVRRLGRAPVYSVGEIGQNQSG